MTWDRRAILAAGAALSALPAEAAEAPRRIVSLNACLDAMLVHLADRGQIAALSHYAREPQGSTIAAVARTLPFTWESAEEVISLRPDLVLASRHSAPATRNALQRLGVRAERFSVPKTIEDSRAQVRRVAKLVGRPARGEALVARIDMALDAARPAPGTRPLTALVYQPNGFSPGPGTLADEMMTLAGFENMARRYGLKAWGNVPLERLLADPPQVLLVGEASPGMRSWADRVMTHPALSALKGRMRQARLPERLLYCGGPVLIESAATLAHARRSFGEGRA
ncbi:MAG: ABC transporter substrate-binding protein [Phenylobacterium zucineum]|nr:MAG: ABC transporter substrate-binding protein [Phenylobacterium zucineum]